MTCARLCMESYSSQKTCTFEGIRFEQVRIGVGRLKWLSHLWAPPDVRPLWWIQFCPYPPWGTGPSGTAHWKAKIPKDLSVHICWPGNWQTFHLGNIFLTIREARRALTRNESSIHKRACLSLYFVFVFRFSSPFQDFCRIFFWRRGNKGGQTWQGLPLLIKAGRLLCPTEKPHLWR